MVAARALKWCSWVAAFAAAASACAHDDGAATVAPAAAGPTDAAAPPDAAEAAPPVAPYPAGPYGATIGATIADFTILGYRLGPDTLDPTRLPLEALRLSELRAAQPRCTCMVIQVVGSGQACFPSRESELALKSAVLRDPSLCVVEVIDHNLDTLTAETVAAEVSPPPTRADLDTTIAQSRQPWPIGLRTKSSVDALAAKWLGLVPVHWVVRPKDMRLVDLLAGSTGRPGMGGLVKSVRAACGDPREPATRVLEDVRPRKLVTHDGQLYVSTEDRGVLRVPSAGGAATTVAPPGAALPDALAVDDGFVYWASHDGVGPFGITRASHSGGALEVVVSHAAGIEAFALDGDYVYFARNDGVIGRAPKTGGAAVELVANALTRSLAVLADTLYWVTPTGDVEKAPKAGGPATLLTPRSAFPVHGAVELSVSAGRLLVRAARMDSGSGLGAIMTVMPDGTLRENIAANGNPVAFAWGASEVALVNGDARGDGFLIRRRLEGDDGPGMVSGDLRRVTSLALAGPYAYWASAATATERGAVWRVR